MNKTCIFSKQQNKKWYLIDAENQILGRLASQIIKILLGKHSKTYAPFLLSNTCLIIINAKKICISGNKINNKKYLTYSGYPSGLHFKKFFELQQKQPEKLLRIALLGMLPKNLLKFKIAKQVYIYSDTNHLHFAQFPQPLFL